MAKDDRIGMRTDSEFVSEVDEWRGKQRPIPSRAEAIRLLVRLGLRVHAQAVENAAA